jgi:hypothetical protein
MCSFHSRSPETAVRTSSWAPNLTTRTLVRRPQSRHARQPAIFRETALDTHNTRATEDFGFAARGIVLERTQYPTRTYSAATGNETKRERQAQQALSKLATLSPTGEIRTVFQPTKEQMPVCQVAGERRANVYNSEWALLDTLDVSMYLSEKEAREKTARARVEGQRAILDSQVAALQAAKASGAGPTHRCLVGLGWTLLDTCTHCRHTAGSPVSWACMARCVPQAAEERAKIAEREAVVAQVGVG